MAETLQELYALLDRFLAEDVEAEALDEVYEKIMDLSFARLGDLLVEGERFDLKNPEDLFALRGVYEHALQRWDEGDFRGAAELFGVLAHMVDDEELKKSFLLSLALAAQKESMDRFLDEFVDLQNARGFFFVPRKEKAEEYLKKHSRLIESELEKIRRGG